MSWTRNQSNDNYTTSPQPSLGTLLSSAVSVGDLIAVGVVCESTSAPSISSVTDSLGNAYNFGTSHAYSVGSLYTLVAIYYSIATAGGSSNTITVAPLTAVSISMAVGDYTYSGSGTLSLDSVCTAAGTGTTPDSGNAAIDAVDLVFGIGSTTSYGASWSAGSGFNLLATHTGNAIGPKLGFAVEDQLNVTSGPIAATFSLSLSQDWSACVATFAALSTLQAGEGSYVLTGKSAGLYHDRVIVAAEGVYTQTGQSAGLTANVGTLTASEGVYALTGDSAGLYHGRVAEASHGVYTLTGENASLGFGVGLVAGTGAFALTGDSAGLFIGHTLDATAGSYLLTGENADLYLGDFLDAAEGSYAVSRIPADLLWDHVLLAGTGACVVTGEPAVLQQPYSLIATEGTYALTGENAGLYHDRQLTAAEGVYTLTGLPASLYASAPGTIGYHVYANTGVGDPIDYNVAIDTTTGLTYTTSPLAYPGTWIFGVRAFDAFGEEQNIDCAVTIILSSAGVDITNQPAPPTALRALAQKAGAVRVEWYYARPAITARTPTGFHVYLGTGSTPNYASPALTVLYTAAIAGTFGGTVPGLANGVTYAVGVRAYNATAEEDNTHVVSVTAVTVGPSAVVDLSAITTV